MVGERGLREMLEDLKDGLVRLESIWKQIESITESEIDQKAGEDIQVIKSATMKLGEIRDLLNQVEIKLDSLEDRVSAIESMRFRIRSGL
jgi:hypothetical protein